MNIAPILGALALLLAAPRQEIDAAKVDEAIQAGVETLKRLQQEDPDPRADELVLWALLHAGVGSDDSFLKVLLDRAVKAPLEYTYNAALQAMVLEKVDRIHHQPRIYECAQFLADNQCRDGQWSYGQAIKPLTPPLPPVARKSTGTQAVRRVRVVPRPMAANKSGRDNGTESGDFSNTQFAALGIRSCHDAGIEFPREFLMQAREAWIEGQYSGPPSGRKGEKIRPPSRQAPKGWGYKLTSGEGRDYPPFGSMTAGAVGSIVIYDFLLGIDWKRDPAVASGLAWLGAHFSASENPENKDRKLSWYHYYLYSIERAGALFGTEQIGTHDWYREGARALLDTQRSGGWSDNGGGATRTLQDTCFAILFLRRATRPLKDVPTASRPRAGVASEDRSAPRK